ncbi:MAG: dTDP-4-dehydrorhamnose 3,5-epimerase family protein [Patescibacteria group bacterium]
MKIFERVDLALDGLQVVKFAKFKDERGYFCESFKLSDFKTIDGFKDFEFMQSNESYSKKNVIRGLHFQWNPRMGKLVRTISGHMVDIALDIRKDSPTFGKAILYDMPQNIKDGEGQWIWLPPGFAHGNFFLEDTLIEYFCTGSYNPECERGISAFSSDIDFSLADKDLKNKFDEIKNKGAIVSYKDINGISLSAWKKDLNFPVFAYKN